MCKFKMEYYSSRGGQVKMWTEGMRCDAVTFCHKIRGTQEQFRLFRFPS